jgi:GNAT superfamily N-acetyltransferase
MTAAFELNLFSLFDLFKQWPQADVHDTPEILWTITDIPFALFNCVARPRLSSSRVDAVIDLLFAECKSRNVPLMWWFGPSAQPSDLGSVLSERGLQCSVSPAMAVDLSTLPESYVLPKDLQIKRVENRAELKIYCQVLAGVFGMPEFVADAFYDFLLNLGFDSSFINYIGLIDDQIVATSSVCLGGGVAGVYNVATLESARRKGVGAAMTAIPLLEARSAGYRVAALESSESGYSVYQKLGFQEYCKISRYVWMGDQ